MVNIVKRIRKVYLEFITKFAPKMMLDKLKDRRKKFFNMYVKHIIEVQNQALITPYEHKGNMDTLEYISHNEEQIDFNFHGRKMCIKTKIFLREGYIVFVTCEDDWDYGNSHDKIAIPIPNFEMTASINQYLEFSNGKIFNEQQYDMITPEKYFHILNNNL